MKDLHMHTVFSDGKNTPEEMVQEAIRRGLDTVGISDHSHLDPCGMTIEASAEYRAEILPEDKADFISDVPLENSGMITHRELGARFFLYEPAVSREKYAEMVNKESVNRFFGGSYMEFISCLVDQQEISVDELKELIRMVEKK